MSAKPAQASIFRFTLAQMWLSLPRLIAGGLAIAIGSAFVAATLLAGDIMTETARNSVGASYGRADLVIEQSTSDRQLAALRSVPGVAAVSGRQVIGADLAGPRFSSYTTIASVATDRKLEPQQLASGTWPGKGQIALPVETADRLGVKDGGSVILSLSSDAVAEGRNRADRRTTLTVSGLLTDPSGAFDLTGGVALAPGDAVSAWSRYRGEEQTSYSPTLVLTRPGADVAGVQAAAAASMRQLGLSAGPYGQDSEAPVVLTRDEQSDRAVAQFTGDTRMMFAFVLAFAAIALLVAALVIANTFQVLVAQRTQTLALLRCIGAVKQQLRRSVLIEALLVGLVASAAGVLGGSLLAQATLLVLRRLEVARQLPATIHLSIWVLVVPVVVGTVVTLIASLSPARAATRVAPLAALRPDAGPRLRERAGRARFALSLGSFLTGVALLGLGLVAGSASPVAGLGIGVLGGALSFLGVVLGTVFWVPRMASALGRLVAVASGGAAPARLAAVNSVRNPRRTAATSGALLIGVTLVALMTTGAATARTSLAENLDASYPVDIAVGNDPSYEESTPVSPAQLEAVRKTPGVADVVPVPGAGVQSRLPGQGATPSTLFIRGISAADGDRVLKSAAVREAVSQGRVAMSTRALTGDRPATVQLRAGDGWRAVPVAWVLRGSSDLAIAPLGLLRQVAPKAVAAEAWVSMAPGAAPGQVYEDVQASLASLTYGQGSSTDEGSLPVSGNAVERSSYDKAINGILAVVVGLLAVSVVIALVGVANTLSLSVLERRRESATLRTIGLTRRQLRWMLAVEGMVIATVGAVVGVLLGVAYGWIGTRTVLGGLTDVGLDVPWVQLGLTVAVAVLAGLLASVIPARGAARTSPVAALATT